jgi:DMSO reductase anchor subunit
MMSVNAGLYFFDVAPILRLIFEAITLAVGLYGIYAQGMIYQIEARPSWNRMTTLLKFFGTAYTGLYLLAFGALVLGQEGAVIPLISAGMALAVAQGFFTFEDRRALKMPQKYERELTKTKRIYDELFPMQTKIRIVTFISGAILLPLIVTVFVGAGLNGVAIAVLSLAFTLMVASELFDRFLFYVTSVPLSMAGGFFVGNQR